VETRKSIAYPLTYLLALVLYLSTEIVEMNFSDLKLWSFKCIVGGWIVEWFSVTYTGRHFW